MMTAGIIGTGVGLIIWLLGAVVALAAFIFWIIMLVDAIRNPRLSDTTKLMWVLLMIFLPFLGTLIYFFVGRNPAV